MLLLLSPFGLLPEDWAKIMDKGIMFAVSLLLVVVLAKIAWIKLNDWEAHLKIERQKLHVGDDRNVKLLEHRFFTAMDFYLNTRIPILPIREPGRAKIFRDFLDLQFRVLRDNMHDLIRNHDIAKLPQMQFEPLMMDYLNHAIEEYETTAAKEGIPDIVMEKFALWHRGSTEQTSNFLLRVTQSPWYGSNIQKTVAILDYLTTVMHSTLLDAQFTLSRLNGELDGLTYKGVLVQPYKRFHRGEDDDSGTHPGLMQDEFNEAVPLPPVDADMPPLPPCHTCDRRAAWKEELNRGHRKV